MGTAEQRPLLSPHPAQRCKQSEPKHLKHNSQLSKITSHGPILMNTRLYVDRSPASRAPCGLCPCATRRPGGQGAAPRPGCAAFVSRGHGGLGDPAAPPQVPLAPPGPAGTGRGQRARPRGGTSARDRDGPGQAGQSGAGQGGQVGNGSKTRLPEAEGTT